MMEKLFSGLRRGQAYRQASDSRNLPGPAGAMRGLLGKDRISVNWVRLAHMIGASFVSN